MLTIDQHFASGYLPALSGAYFNLVLLLGQCADSGVPEVEALARTEVPRLKLTGEGVKENVRLVHALAEIAGFVPPAAPSSPDDYFAWFSEIYAGFHDRNVLHHRGEIAHIVGHGVGDMLCTWNVALVVVRVRMADPDSPTLEQQWVALREDLRNTRDATLIHGHHPNAPAPLTALCDKLDAAVDALLNEEPGSDADDLNRLGHRLTEGMRRLSDAVVEARALLRADEATAEA